MPRQNAGLYSPEVSAGFPRQRAIRPTGYRKPGTGTTLYWHGVGPLVFLRAPTFGGRSVPQRERCERCHIPLCSGSSVE